MNNGESTLIKGFSANIFAAVLFFFGAVVSLLSGFAGWLGFIMLVIAAALFFVEGNAFIRRACFTLMLLYVLTLVSWLLFSVILRGAFFSALNWIIDIVVTLFLVFSGLCALNGKSVDIPFLANFIDYVCK